MEEQSSLSQNIFRVDKELATTMCTTASTIIPTVPVQECHILANGENPIETLFGQATTENGSTVQQIISLRSLNKLYSAKSPGEIGHNVKKLEVFLFSEVSKVESPSAGSTPQNT